DTMKQMAQAVQGTGLGSAQDYLNAATRSSWQAQYDFLQGAPATAPDNLEGFLFPDTYQMSPSGGVRGLVQAQLNAFGQVFPPAPISNPSLASLTACVSPQKTPYYYFFVDKGGTTRYARNSVQFQQEVAQYGVG